MNVIGHDTVCVKLEAFMLSAKIQTVYDYISVRVPGKYINPVDYRRGNKVWQPLIKYFIVTAHPD